MKKVKFIYTLFLEGNKYGKVQVTVSNNLNAFTEVEEKISRRYQVSKFNHAGKTVTLDNL